MADKSWPREEAIERVRAIIAEYEGMRLTLRQIYYRLVATQFFQNIINNYKKLSDVLARARENGRIPWDAIEDRTREVHDGHGEEWGAAEYLNVYLDYIRRLDDNYTMPTWWGQPVRMFVCLEKDALYEVFRQVTDAEGVDLVPLRGYSSVTLLKDLADRMVEVPEYVKRVEVLYFGDFDPTGENIEQVLARKLEEYGAEADFNRVAITQAQIDEYNIPTAPAKTTDTRYSGFVERHGVAWQVELDAIEPRTLQNLIREVIRTRFDSEVGLVREQELESRRARLREWSDEALNDDFEPPKEVA